MSPSKQDKSNEKMPQYSGPLSIARAFANAYLAGQISVDWPTKKAFDSNRGYMEAISGDHSERWKNADYIETRARAVNELRHRAMIVLGADKASVRQRRATARSLVHVIWRMRSSGQLKGKFLAIPNLELRLTRIESKIRGHSRLLKELQLLLRSNPRQG